MRTWSLFIPCFSCSWQRYSFVLFSNYLPLSKANTVLVALKVCIAYSLTALTHISNSSVGHLIVHNSAGISKMTVSACKAGRSERVSWRKALRVGFLATLISYAAWNMNGGRLLPPSVNRSKFWSFCQPFKFFNCDFDRRRKDSYSILQNVLRQNMSNVRDATYLLCVPLKAMPGQDRFLFHTEVTVMVY